MMATKNPFQGDDYDFFETARDESGAIKREAPKPAAKPTKTAAKAPIVTKEQMRKAGFDNLRDYLNAQRGLTRRGEKPAAKSAPADTRRVGPTRERAADMPPMVRKPDASTSRGVRAADTSAPKAKPFVPTMTQRRRPTPPRDLPKVDPRRDVAGRRGNIRQKMIDGKELTPNEEAFAKRNNMMAKGGSVRGSGIARQGVRKAKMM